jgi:hypothetical protein
MVMSVMNQLTCIVVELSAITKIQKYKRFHERHHFILIAMKVHNAPMCDMDCFIKECACLFTIDNQKVIYPCLVAFILSSNMLILFFMCFGF